MINIVIAAQQPIFRTGLAKLIATEDDLRIVAQPLLVAHLQNAIARLRPHVMLLSSDFLLSEEDFLDIMRLTTACSCATLVLTEEIGKALEFVALGVRGILPRRVHADTLITSIRRIAGGEVCLQTEADGEPAFNTDPVGQKVASRLSKREVRIMAAMLRGLKNAEIAEQLGITLPLLKKYIGGIYDKAGVWGRLELALFALHHQVLALANPSKRLAGLTAGGMGSRAVERMFGAPPKSERRSAVGSPSRGTSLGTTGAPPRYGK